jgi:peptide deformylase
MILDFNQVKNPQEREILKTPAVFVDDIAMYISLIEDIQDTAKENEEKCIGIASNQIWKEKDSSPPAIFIIKLQQATEWKVFINPKIKGSGKKIKMTESCMSLVGRKPKLKKRDKNVTITYWDPLDRTIKTEKYFGFDARAIQHECDHLKGILI